MGNSSHQNKRKQPVEKCLNRKLILLVILRLKINELSRKIYAIQKYTKNTFWVLLRVHSPYSACFRNKFGKLQTSDRCQSPVLNLVPSIYLPFILKSKCSIPLEIGLFTGFLRAKYRCFILLIIYLLFIYVLLLLLKKGFPLNVSPHQWQSGLAIEGRRLEAVDSNTHKIWSPLMFGDFYGFLRVWHEFSLSFLRKTTMEGIPP